MKKLLGFSAVLVTILLLAGGVFLVFRLAQFKAAVNELRSEGYPVSIADLSRPAKDPEQDAMLLLNRLQSQLGSFETEMFIDKDALTRPVDDAMIARFNELNVAYPEVFPLIERLSQATEVSIDLGDDSQEFLDSRLARWQRVRSCARVLAWKSRVLAAQGKPDDSIAANLQTLQISRLFDGQPLILWQLVSLACRNIAVEAIHDVIVSRPISGQMCDELNRELERHDSLPGYRTTLVGERSFGIEMITESGIFAMAHGGIGYLEVMSKEIEDSENEDFETERVMTSPSLYSKLINGWFAQSMSPAIEATRQAISRTRSNIRALRIINALLAQPEAEGKTITPEYLLEIEVPQPMTVDTITGETMKVKHTESGWLVYSVGTNREDDGGDSDQLKDFVLGGKH